MFLFRRVYLQNFINSSKQKSYSGYFPCDWSAHEKHISRVLQATIKWLK